MALAAIGPVAAFMHILVSMAINATDTQFLLIQWLLVTGVTAGFAVPSVQPKFGFFVMVE